VSETDDKLMSHLVQVVPFAALARIVGLI